MKAFLKRILFLLPIPVLMVSANYFGDPANLYNDNYELGIADCLIQGNNVTNVENLDDRLLQKIFIEKMNHCPTAIALGSSRIMQINSENLKEKHFINSGVVCASLEDEIAIYYLYEKKGCKIQKVLLGIDPWMLNDNNNQNQWKFLKDEYSFFVSNLLHKPIENSLEDKLLPYIKYEELLSFSYFNASLIYLAKGEDKKYIATKNTLNEGYTRIKDGSIVFDALDRNASPEVVMEKAKNTIGSNPLYNFNKRALNNFTQLSEHYKLIFSTFIEHLQKQNIEIDFYLSPYHPIVYDCFKKNNYYHFVFEAESYFRNFAHQHKIKVLGSFDPLKYNLDNSYFFDGIHCNQKAIKKILQNDSIPELP